MAKCYVKVAAQKVMSRSSGVCFVQAITKVVLGLGVLVGYACFFFFFQAEDGIRDSSVTGVQTCALPILFAEPAHDRRTIRQFALLDGFRHAGIPAGSLLHF